MKHEHALLELNSLMKTRDFLIHRVSRSRARESEKAMTIGKYEREKQALRLAIDLINRDRRNNDNAHAS